jgi:hypothetical protein
MTVLISRPSQRPRLDWLLSLPLRLRCLCRQTPSVAGEWLSSSPVAGFADICIPFWRLVVTKVHVLQVNTDPANVADLTAAVAAGRTDEDGWQMPKNAAAGDLVIWYAAGRQQFIARGWVEEPPRPVKTGPGPFRGRVAGMRWIKPVDRRKVLEEIGLNGGLQSYQTVKDEVAVAFLQSVGLLD